jgi:hypothetical protein
MSRLIGTIFVAHYSNNSDAECVAMAKRFHEAVIEAGHEDDARYLMGISGAQSDSERFEDVDEQENIDMIDKLVAIASERVTDEDVEKARMFLETAHKGNGNGYPIHRFF